MTIPNGYIEGVVEGHNRKVVQNRFLGFYISSRYSFVNQF